MATKKVYPFIHAHSHFWHDNEDSTPNEDED